MTVNSSDEFDYDSKDGSNYKNNKESINQMENDNDEELVEEPRRETTMNNKVIKAMWKLDTYNPDDKVIKEAVKRDNDLEAGRDIIYFAMQLITDSNDENEP